MSSGALVFFFFKRACVLMCVYNRRAVGTSGNGQCLHDPSWCLAVYYPLTPNFLCKLSSPVLFSNWFVLNTFTLLLFLKKIFPYPSADTNYVAPFVTNYVQFRASNYVVFLSVNGTHNIFHFISFGNKGRHLCYGLNTLVDNLCVLF